MLLFMQLSGCKRGVPNGYRTRPRDGRRIGPRFGRTNDHDDLPLLLQRPVGAGRFSFFGLTMNIELDNLRSMGVQTYDRTGFRTPREPYRRYLRKEFDETSIAEEFHVNTKHRTYEDPFVGQSVSRFLEDDAMVYATANVDPDYPGEELVPLPEPEPLDVSLDSALRSRRSVRTFTGEGISRSALSTLLGQSVGVTESKTVLRDDDGQVEVNQDFRAYPSGGGLYPVEHYVLVPHSTDSLDAGLYYYVPGRHALRRIEGGDGDYGESITEYFMADLGAQVSRNAAAVVFMTGAFWRSMAKYGDRGYRFVLQEAGHVGQNLLLVAEAMGLSGLPFDGVKDVAVDDLLGVNGVDESLVYTVVVGHPAGDPDA